MGWGLEMKISKETKERGRAKKMEDMEYEGTEAQNICMKG